MRNPFEVYTSLRSGEKNKPLEWEESAPDSQGHVEGFFDEERTAPQLQWLWGILVVCFIALNVKLFYLQIIQGSKFHDLSESNRIRKQTVLAPRGVIKDRNGEVLAQNTASFSLVAVPFDLPKEGLASEEVKLEQVFGLDSAEVNDKLKSIDRNSFQPIVIKSDLTQDQSILFDTMSRKFIGFDVQKVPIRQYLDPQVFSHVLGYTGILSPGELVKLDQNKYDTNDYIGKTGIEAQYEQFLHGTNGENLVQVDASGKLQNVLGQQEPLPGNVLQLNIDKGLQERLYHGLTDNNPNRKAAAVAINPKTGEVLALVSVPGFDNNLFAQGIRSDEYKALLSDPSLPLFNRTLAGTYPPGSTVKPMVATAALQEGVINPNTIITDRGVLVVPNQFNRALSYSFHGWKAGGLGPMTVRSAIALSSDIFFYVVAGGAPNTAVVNGLGADKLAEYYRKFNLGNTTGIDMEGEKTGLVPDPAWKLKYFKKDPILSKWYLGDTYHIGIGQGDLLVTPLQVAEWTAIIANNGTGYKPRIAKAVIDSNGKVVSETKREVLVSNVASPDVLKIVQEGMRQTVLAGTAKPLASLPITSAGKTGTSQFDGSDPNRTHAWFTAYAPYEDPQIVITVLVEAGGEGNAVSEPVVKDALGWWAQNRYKK